MEHQAKREAGLDGDRRIARLTAPRTRGGGMPCVDGFRGEPDREAAPLDQRGIVFRPVLHPVFGFWDFMAAAFIELVRHGASERWGIASHRLSYKPPPSHSF